MAKKQTHKELEQSIKELKKENLLLKEHKHLTESLQERESRYRAVVENQTEMICCFLPEGTITFVNDAYCRFFNKQRKELIGIKFTPFIPQSDLKKVHETISSLSPDASIVTHEHRVLAPDKKLCWHRWTNRAIFDDQNNLLEYHAVGWDITERKQAEDALRESEENFRALAENANDGILIVVEDGRHAYANRRVAEITGYSISELLKTTIRDLAHPDEFEKIIKRYKTIIAGKPFQRQYETMIIRKDGKHVPIEVVSAKFAWHGQPADIVLIRDITERSWAEKALREAYDKLEERVENRTRELKSKTKNLEEVNTALKVLLKQRENDRTELEEKILFNVKEMITPFLNQLKKTNLDGVQMDYVNVLESNLNEIISPFFQRLSINHLKLTPSEIQIANFVKQGKTSKQIARMLNLSSRTIETHRKNIREKLGIKSQKANLRSYLLSIQ